MPVIYWLITCLPYWPSIRKFQRQQPIKAPDAAGAALLLCIAKGQTYDTQDWKKPGKQFRVNVTNDVTITQLLFCFGVQPHDPFPLARQCICAAIKLASQVNRTPQQWQSQGAQIFGVAAAFVEPMKPLANCHGFSESKQLDFTRGLIWRCRNVSTPRAPAHFAECNLISVASVE
jgi:hypothetical protein